MSESGFTDLATHFKDLLRQSIKVTVLEEVSYPGLPYPIAKWLERRPMADFFITSTLADWCGEVGGCYVSYPRKRFIYCKGPGTRAFVTLAETAAELLKIAPQIKQRLALPPELGKISWLPIMAELATRTPPLVPEIAFSKQAIFWKDCEIDLAAWRELLQAPPEHPWRRKFLDDFDPQRDHPVTIGRWSHPALVAAALCRYLAILEEPAPAADTSPPVPPASDDPAGTAAGTPPAVPLAEDGPECDSILRAIVAVWTGRYVANEKMASLYSILESDGSVDEKLWAIDGVLPIPPTSSASMLGKLCGCSGSAVKKTSWWKQRRRGRQQERVGEREERLRERGKRYEL